MEWSMDWKHLLASITHSVDEELRLRNAYLAAENRILRHQIIGRGQLTDAERTTLAELGQQLGKKTLAEIATIATADTILAWRRKRIAQKGDGTQQRQAPGRPRINQEIEDVVLRMARENRTWDYDRIQGALKHLGYAISDQTVGNILKRHGIPPAPVRKTTTTWPEFIHMHLAVLSATDFFTSAVWGWWGLVISCLLSWRSFACDHVCVVRMRLDHLVRRMRLFLRQALDGHACWQSSVHVVKECARLQMISCGEGVLGTTVAESTRSEKRHTRTQNMAQVVCLSTAYHRQIRDGPRQRQQWLDGLWKDDDCEAA